MFRVGSIVYLSSKPHTYMTVERIYFDICDCVWFDQNNILNRSSFKKELLKLKDIPYTIPEVISYNN